MTHLKKTYSMQELTEVAHDIYNVDPSYTCDSMEAMKEEGEAHYSYVKFEMTSSKPNMPMITLEHDLLVEAVQPEPKVAPLEVGDALDVADGTHEYMDRLVEVANGFITDIWNKPNDDQTAFELEAMHA